MKEILKFGAALTVTIVGVVATVITGKECFFEKVSVREINDAVEEVF